MQNLFKLFEHAYTMLLFIYRYGFQGFRIFTHLTWEERIILYRFAKEIKSPACFLEIGSYLGASAYFMAATASEAGNNKKLYCVDTWQNDAMAEGKRDTWKEFAKNIEQFSGNIIAIRGLSDEIGKSFFDELDLLFIDGDHTYDACKNDVDIWLPKVKSGGKVLFHDYGWAEGVQTVVNNLVLDSMVINGKAYKNIYWCDKA